MCYCHRFLFAGGVALIGISLAGKTFISFYRLVKTGSAFRTVPSQLAYMYKGGFEQKMSTKEAALILGVK
jgi:hypothetical protein